MCIALFASITCLYDVGETVFWTANCNGLAGGQYSKLCRFAVLVDGVVCGCV